MSAASDKKQDAQDAKDAKAEAKQDAKDAKAVAKETRCGVCHRMSEDCTCPEAA